MGLLRLGEEALDFRSHNMLLLESDDEKDDAEDDHGSMLSFVKSRNN